MGRQAREVVVEPRSNVLPLRRRDGSTPSVQPTLYDVELEPKGREPVILPPYRAQLMAQTVVEAQALIRTPNLATDARRAKALEALDAVVAYLRGDDE
jgi:hypothetical protein